MLYGLEFQPFRDRAGWFVCTDPQCARADQVGLSELASERTESAAGEGYQIFCGLLDDAQAEHRLFAVTDTDPCELIREFRVGSHNQANRAVEDATVEAVFTQMHGIYAVRPFRPYFIDAAGYHCRFVGSLTRDEAIAIERLFKEGGESYAANWDGDDEDYVLTQLLSENELHLWWD